MQESNLQACRVSETGQPYPWRSTGLIVRELGGIPSDQVNGESLADSCLLALWETVGLA